MRRKLLKLFEKNAPNAYIYIIGVDVIIAMLVAQFNAVVVVGENVDVTIFRSIFDRRRMIASESLILFCGDRSVVDQLQIRKE